MTINATAAWLLALYIAVADEQGAPRAKLQGTTQNDIVKEYLSRGTYVFPPAPSMRLIKDTILFTTAELPKWNPMNVCSYHLQEAGATPVQELAYALATAIAVLDTVKASGEVKPEAFGEVVGRISFFVNAGLRFITEMCKMRAFCELWDEITRERYGVTDPKQRLFRYGVQVNSLGLTEQQAENNVYRILIEMLAVTLSKNARARAVQLPAWNEALGLPRPFDQQWSLRMQQILAYETDLLEYGDIFDGSKEIAAKVEELKREAREELARHREDGRRDRGGRDGLHEGAARRAATPGAARGDRARRADRGRRQQVHRDRAFAARRPAKARSSPCRTRSRPSRSSGSTPGARRATPRPSRPRCRSCALPLPTGATSCRPRSRPRKPASPPANGRGVLREAFGEYRAPTGVGRAARNESPAPDEVRADVERVSQQARPAHQVPGRQARPRRPLQRRRADRGARARCRHGGGLRGHPPHAGRDRQRRAEEGVHVVGLSILSGSHVPLVKDVVARMREAGLDDVPVIVGGIIPPDDADTLRAAGVAAVYTPKDFELNRIMADIVRIVDTSASEEAA